jgi:Na+/proline symporter
MIAMSSILSFDIYGRYFNKTPNNEQLIRWSHIGVVISSLGVSTIVLAFHYGNVNMTWLLYAFGMIVCPGVFPTTFSLVWSRQTKAAAIISPIVGMVCGLSVWFGTAYRYYGNVTIDSTGGTMPCLFGVVAAFFIPLPISVLISFVFPQKPFDFGVFRKIHKVNPDNTATGAETETQIEVEEAYFTEERLKYMKRMSRWAALWTVSAIIGHVLLWPLPMYGARMVFSKSVRCCYLLVLPWT